MSDKTSIVTEYRRKSLCEVTSGAIIAIPKVTHIAFGNGGVDTDGEPIEPDGTQTALTSELARYPIKAVSYPVNTTARYVAEIPLDDLTGEKINEAGLIDEAGNLCAIKTMYDKGKDADVIFSFTFDDEF